MASGSGSDEVGSEWWVGARTPLLHVMSEAARPVISGDQVFYQALCRALVLATRPVADDARGLRRCAACVRGD